MKKEGELTGLVSIGPKMAAYLKLIGITTVEQLKGQNAGDIYERLCAKKGFRIDVCCLDTFTAAIAQVKNPKLPAKQKHWWYWSRIRLKKQR